ncbi:MAG: molybdopterin-dependent oxidoreductase [Desulfobacterales bacterium]|nr:molybdopterin-dependent oxidoreductase [Desulfobacterales bacterium]
MEHRFNTAQTPGGKVPFEGSGIEVRQTICAICNPNSHCGIDAYVRDGVVIKVEGTKDHPHSAGTLCSKGAASREYIYHKDRLRTPLLRKGPKGLGQFEPISWEEALDRTADKLLKIKKKTGPESVAFFVGYTKWMRPFVKRLAHSFGSPNYCTESSTCHTATVIAAKLNYGCFGPPDVGNAKCLLVWSNNPFYSNSSAVRRLLDARERGLKIIEVGPLITPLTRHADIHLRLRPGTSGALALGIAHVIIEEGLFDLEFVEKWTLGFEEYSTYVKGFSPQATEGITGVPADLIKRAARLYARTKPAALMTSASPTVHHTNGVQNHRAITALIGLTGNFDVKGGNTIIPPATIYVPGPPATRQDEYEQSRPWSEMPPRMAEDLYPVWSEMIPQAQAMELPFQIRSGKPYPIRAVVGFGMNHRMWPGSDFIYESLQRLDFFVQVELFMTDTCKMADIVLPACTSFERSELKFYPEKYVIWTEPVIKPLWESRSDADIIFDLAKRLAPEDSLLQKGYEANMDWLLEPTGLTVEALKRHPAGLYRKNVQAPPYRKYEKTGFPTPSGKMEFTSTVLRKHGLDPLPGFHEPKLSPRSAPELAGDFPLILTTGARLPMVIHSRTFRLSWTRGLRPDPMADIHPKDADERGILQGDWITLSTPRHSVKLKANLTEIVPPGVTNVYHGYVQPEVNRLIDPDYLDPISGFPGFKSLICQVKKLSERKEDR